MRPGVLQPAVTLKQPWRTRHKVKMSVSGSVQNPIVGLTRRDRSTQELLECSLSTEPIQSLLHELAVVISSHSLTPYDIERRRGELKFIIVTTTHDHQEGIVRFVLRSHELIPHITAALPRLMSVFPWIRVVSCNIQPLHAAILGGPEEVVLTESSLIRELFGVVPLYFAPQSFMQVTPAIASQLYAQAAEIVQRAAPRVVLDLYCGVGGFSLSAAPHCREVHGVEISEQAILCAQRSARELAYEHTLFTASDVDAFVRSVVTLSPDLLIVNPPRRGLSEAVREYARRAKPKYILYSSCNPETFAQDVAAISNDYALEELTPFDMFPMTMHWEVLGFFVGR
jgi:23S rRNA (uracil747-C5)-methyltransferase